MLRAAGFPALITKVLDVKERIKDTEDVISKTHIKMQVEISGEQQYFLKSLEEQTGITGINNPLQVPVIQEAGKNNLKNYDNTSMVVNIGDDVDGQVEFDAKLLRVDWTRKYVDGFDIFTYTLTFVKDSDPKIDSIVREAYLGVLEKKVVGMKEKTVKKTFHTTVELATEETNEDIQVL